MENRIGKFTNNVLEIKILEDYTRREVDDNGKEVTILITATSQLPAMLENGWKPVEEIDTTQLECSKEFYSTLVEPIEKEETIGFIYTKRLDKRLVSNEIDKQKAILSNEDYKITKCYEASLLGMSLPYDIASLHSQREEKRQIINCSAL